MPHQNLSHVDWWNKNYFNFSVQTIYDVLAVLGANMLDQIPPQCSHLISRNLVEIFKEVLA